MLRNKKAAHWSFSASSAAMLAATMSFCPPASAQEAAEIGEREQIIVTATRREMTVQDVPQSIQVVSGTDIQDLAITSIEDITRLTPNLNLDVSRKYGGSFNIRGIGVLVEGFTQFATVGLYVDETPISDAFANLDVALYDVARIEVLKGPQGTLYGEGSLAGTVRIITNQPDLNDYSASVMARSEFTKKGDPSYRVAGAVNMPILEDVAALRVTASYDKRGGLMDAAPFPAGAPIAEDVDDAENIYVRSALKLAPAEGLTLTPSFVYQKSEIDSGAVDMIALPDLTGYANGPDNFDEELFIYALEAEYEFPWATLTSSTSYYDRNFHSVDDDIITNAIISALIAPTPATTQFFDKSLEAFTQEVRLASKSEGPVNWIVGGFYRNRKFDELVSIDSEAIGLATGGDPRVFFQDNQAEFEQFAAFGEINVDVLENLTLTGGVRWFNEDITSDVDFGTFSVITFAFEETAREPVLSEEDVLLKFAASYYPTDAAMIYAQYSQGYRPGGVNDRVLDIFGVLSPEEVDQLLTYEQDETANYEIGYKSTLFDERVTFNLTGFYIDWSNVQIDQDIPGVPGPLFTVNAAKARSIGVELEFLAELSERLDVGVFAGYSDAEIRKEVVSAGGVIPKGAAMPHAPNFAGNAFVQYTHPLGRDLKARLRADLRHVGDRKAGIDAIGDPARKLEGYQMFDVLAALENTSWSASLYVKNLTDERTELDAFLFDDDIFGDALAGYARSRPRTIGVQLQARF